MQTRPKMDRNLDNFFFTLDLPIRPVIGVISRRSVQKRDQSWNKRRFAKETNIRLIKFEQNEQKCETVFGQRCKFAYQTVSPENC